MKNSEFPAAIHDQFRSEVATTIRMILEDCPALDAIVSAASKLMYVPISLVSIVERGDQVFAASAGLEIAGTPRSYSFCSYAILSPEPLEVLDATLDPRFADNPLVTGEPHIRYYLGLPIADQNGLPLGTLCVIDTRPRIPATQRQKKVLGNLVRAVEEIVRQQRELHYLRAQAKFLRQGVESVAFAGAAVSWMEGLEVMLSRYQPIVEARDIDIHDTFRSDLAATALVTPVNEVVDLIVERCISQTDRSGRLSISATVDGDVIRVFFLIDSTTGLSPADLQELDALCQTVGIELDTFHHAGSVLEVRVTAPVDAEEHSTVAEVLPSEERESQRVQH